MTDAVRKHTGACVSSCNNRVYPSIYFLTPPWHLAPAEHQSKHIIPAVPHMKFLIVDDSSEMRRMIGAVVADKDDQVLELDDGEHLVATYTSHRPDWVLMDIQMKHVGGLQATHQLKILFPEARVIIVTQYGDKHFRNQAQTAQADAYILKDDLSVLRNIVRGKEPGMEKTSEPAAKQ